MLVSICGGNSCCSLFFPTEIGFFPPRIFPWWIHECLSSFWLLMLFFVFWSHHWSHPIALGFCVVQLEKDRFITSLWRLEVRTRWFRAFTSLVQSLGLVPCSHLVAHSHLPASPFYGIQCSLPALEGTAHRWCTCILQTKHSYTK